MRWLNPVALVGLLALAVPILVHLFGRRMARRQRFPSLRLLQLAIPTPATRSQPSDILLLIVRCAVIVVAVLALAQPLWSNPERARRARTPARAVIVDTSASMRRLTSDGTSALESARALAQSVLDSARAGLVIETDRPGENIAGASSWLEQQSGVRELVLISDFQRGAVHDGDLGTVAEGIGIRAARVDVRSTDSGPATQATADSAVVIRLDSMGTGTGATWLRRAPDSAAFPITVLAARDDAERVRASVDAARQVVPPFEARHAIALVFPGYEGATELARQAGPLTAPWQGDLLLTLQRHALLRDVADPVNGTSCRNERLVPLPNAEGTVAAAVGAAGPGASHELLVFACVDAGSIAGTALLAAVAFAATPGASFAESETTALPDETLRAWERPGTDVAPRGGDETSPDGRWFWLVALLLLMVEEWLRRRTPRALLLRVAEGRERVA